MESLKRALFEDPLYVYVLLAFVELALVGLWHTRLSRRRLAWLALPVVLAVAVFIVERLVLTDREQILEAIDQIAAHVEAGNFDPAAEYLDEDLTGAYGDKAHAVRTGKDILKVFRIKSLRFLDPQVQIERPQAAMRVTTVIVFRGPAAGGRTVLRWKLRWVKRPQGWRILEVDRPQRGVELQ